VGGGCIATIMNTRYGYGAYINGVGYVPGPSERLDTTFFAGVLQYGKPHTGQALGYSKAAWAPYADSLYQYDMQRYCIYDLNLIGDPETPLWTEEPTALAVSHSGVVNIGNNIPYPVTVTTAMDAPVESALVYLRKGTEVDVKGWTNASGQVTLYVSPPTPGEMFLTVNARDHYIFQDTVLVIASDRYVSYLRSSISDPGPGGNNDSILNPGETVKIPMWVKNWGQLTANSVTAKLRTFDPNAQVTDSSKSFGNIAAGDSVYTGSNGFGLRVNSGLGNGYTVVCSLYCRDALDSTWTSVIQLTVGAPILSKQAVTVVDTVLSGNHNGGIDPGETASLMVRLGNTGLGHGHNVHATLRSGDARLVVFDSAGSWGTVRRNDSASNAADLITVHADASIPPETPIACTLHCYADGGYTKTEVFTVIVGMPVGGIIWGPKPAPNMPTGAGICGVTYNTADNLIYCTYFGNSTIYKYSSDSMLTPQGTIAAPQDSCLDIDYMTYSDALWLVCNPQKTMYKLSTSGSVIRQFSLSFANYPYGATECEDGHLVYVTDRRVTPSQPQLIYVRDTLGNYAQSSMTHPLSGPYGTRCLALDGRGSTNTPTLLNIWAWYNAAGSAVDSCGMYELDRVADTLLNGYVFSAKTWDTRGIEYDPRDGSYWVTIAQGGPGNNMIVKVAGFNYGKVGVADPEARSANAAVRLAAYARPSPFTGCTRLTVELPEAGSIDLRIYDNSGRVVRTLARGPVFSKRADFVWDGRNDEGQAVAPGVYFCRVQSATERVLSKVILSR